MRLIEFVLFGANLMMGERNKAVPAGDWRRETEVLEEKRDFLANLSVFVF